MVAGGTGSADLLLFGGLSLCAPEGTPAGLWRDLTLQPHLGTWPLLLLALFIQGKTLAWATWPRWLFGQETTDSLPGHQYMKALAQEVKAPLFKYCNLISKQPGNTCVHFLKIYGDPPIPLSCRNICLDM